MKKKTPLSTIISLLLFTVTNTAIAEEKTKPLLVPDNPDSPCNQLHKVTSRDDLLKQLYETAFRDDCAYQLPREQLAEIWQIPIVPFTTITLEEYRKNPLILYADIESPLDLYVNFDSDFISVELTRNAVKSGKTLFPEDKFPAFFGEPIKIRDSSIVPYVTRGKANGNYKDAGIKPAHKYCWKYRSEVINTSTSHTDIVHRFSFNSNQNHQFIFRCNKPQEKTNLQ